FIPGIMPIQHSPPSRQTRSQVRPQAVLTPTPRSPLDGTLAELADYQDFQGPGEDGGEEEENSVEEEASDGIEGVPAPVRASQGTGGPTLAQSDQPVSHQSEPALLEIMQQMTQIMSNLQAASDSESSRPPAFMTPSMKAPECFDWTQPFKVRSFIPSFQLVFHNDLENFSKGRKEVFYATSFLIGRAAK
ncbi:hypothetical protein O181_103152, partial [Austropuccinia psidii MF-1]|nr:hypothetical protein [Austropuccinia psidii MF-1]